MTRAHFLTFVGIVAVAISAFALVAPAVLLEHVKHAEATASAQVMARTVGVLLLSVGALNLMVRRHPDSPTMRSVLWANLLLQLAILPIDPIAWAIGAFDGLDSFVPNTILHFVLAAGFAGLLFRASADRVPTER